MRVDTQTGLADRSDLPGTQVAGGDAGHLAFVAGVNLVGHPCPRRGSGQGMDLRRSELLRRRGALSDRLGTEHLGQRLVVGFGGQLVKQIPVPATVELAELTGLNTAVAGRGVDRRPVEFVVPVEVLAELAVQHEPAQVRDIGVDPGGLRVLVGEPLILTEVTEGV